MGEESLPLVLILGLTVENIFLSYDVLRGSAIGRQHATSTNGGEGLSQWVEKAPIVTHMFC